MWAPKIKGFEKFQFASWAFLIEHPSGRKLVYDLGVRKDWENLAPAHGIPAMVEGGILEMDVKDDVPNILKTNGVDLEGVEAVIWSHW